MTVGKRHGLSLMDKLCPMHWLWLLACSTPPAQPASPDAPCPPGMVLVDPTGTVGMVGWPYGIVATAHLDKVEAPEADCPAALAAADGASACWVQTDLVDPVLAPRAIAGAPFCIERHPFPGKGARYSADGMTTWDAAQLDELLASGKVGPRRLCTFTELQAAVAGPKANRRFVYGDTAIEMRCGMAGPLGTEPPIGSDPTCSNPETGVHEYGAVHSHWVRADADFVAHACDAPPCAAAGDRPLVVGHLVVAGGTGRAAPRGGGRL